MNYCQNCGNRIEENANFCDYCGTRVIANEKKVTHKQVPPAVVGTQKKVNGFAIAGFACSFFIPLLGFIFGGIGLGYVRKCKSGLGFAIAALSIAFVIFAIRLIMEIPNIIDIVQSLSGGINHIDTFLKFKGL